ncbi:MAG: hypothetical protein Q8O03_09515 [Nanoarchaeota archaeon]|nr:hypothetical protein [Nanoarchaeota archaeon]
MRKSVFLITLLLIVIMLVSGCAQQAPSTGTPGEETEEKILGCKTSEECKTDETCVSGDCQVLSCEKCQYASEHKCLDYECCEDAHCVSGKVCRDNKCIPVTRIEETDSSFRWTGTWILVDKKTDPQAAALISGGSMKGCAVKGDKMEVAFKGSEVMLVTMTCEDCGIASVTVDGVSHPNIDTYGQPGVQIRKSIAKGLTNSRHVLTVACSGNKNPASKNNLIYVDAIDVIV